MSADRTSRFAFWAACVVAPMAVLGSAASLYRIAESAELALPLALPVALDLTALVAAAQIRARRHLLLGWLTLVGGVVCSAALQVADAWDRGPSAWAVHGALPIAALVTFELAMPTHEPETADEGADDGPAEVPTTAPLADPAATHPGTPPTGQPDPAAAPRRTAPPKARRTASRTPSTGQPDRTDEQVIADARALAVELGMPAGELSVNRLRTRLHLSDARAKRVHAALARPLHAVEGAAR